MDINEMYSKFLLAMESSFQIDEIRSGLDYEDFPDVYLWGMLREYNGHKMNPKLYVNKGAFGNLGYPFPSDARIIKFNEKINNETILIDVAQAFPSCEKLYRDDSAAQYIGILLSKNGLSLDDIYQKMEPVIHEYFECEYKNFSDKHIKIMFTYFNQMLAMDCDIVLLGYSLKGERKFFRISKGCNQFEFNRDDLINFPFSKPYSDYLSHTIAWNRHY